MSDVDQLVARMAACYAVPPVRLGVPINDGAWTTPYADFLDRIGMPDEARAERTRVLGPEVRPA